MADNYLGSYLQGLQKPLQQGLNLYKQQQDLENVGQQFQEMANTVKRQKNYYSQVADNVKNDIKNEIIDTTNYTEDGELTEKGLQLYQERLQESDAYREAVKNKRLADIKETQLKFTPGANLFLEETEQGYQLKDERPENYAQLKTAMSLYGKQKLPEGAFKQEDKRVKYDYRDIEDTTTVNRNTYRVVKREYYNPFNPQEKIYSKIVKRERISKGEDGAEGQAVQTSDILKQIRKDFNTTYDNVVKVGDQDITLSMSLVEKLKQAKNLIDENIPEDTLEKNSYSGLAGKGWFVWDKFPKETQQKLKKMFPEGIKKYAGVLDAVISRGLFDTFGEFKDKWASALQDMGYEENQSNKLIYQATGLKRQETENQPNIPSGIDETTYILNQTRDLINEGVSQREALLQAIRDTYPNISDEEIQEKIKMVQKRINQGNNNIGTSGKQKVNLG